MPSTQRPGRRNFAPSWGAALLTIALCAAFAGLGRWQWQRGNAREAQWLQFERGSDAATLLGSRRLDEIARFQKVTVTGEFDSQHQFLLDNRVQAGTAGYEVLTALILPDGRAILVNRGWLPSTGYRERLPDVSVGAVGRQVLDGRVDELPSAGLDHGRAPPQPGGSWPKVTSFPTIEELSAALDRKLEPRLLLLDAKAANGYSRSWQPPGLAPARHWAYAFQWWSFGVVVFVLWVVMSFRKEPS